MKNIYMIKERCPLFDVNFKIIQPFIFTNKADAETCLLDFEWISAERIMCNEYDLIDVELSKELDFIDDWKAIYIENELIEIKIIKDYEEEKFDVHSWDDLEAIGRIENTYDEEIVESYNDSEMCEFECWLDKEYSYKDLY